MTSIAAAAETKTPASDSSADNITTTGTCCLSGLRAPSDVDHLVLLPGSDGIDYSVTKQMLDKYSRQLYVYGIAAMSRMMNSSVLVSGMSGTGIEIAKNVILAGVKSFTVHDTVDTTHMDLSSNFFLEESDVGKNRAEVCVTKLKELNKLTPVTLSTEPLECTKNSVGKYTVVVLVDYHQDRLNEISRYCHENDIIFLATGCYGLYGYAFSDFGKNHTITDTDGSMPLSGLVVGVEMQTAGEDVTPGTFKMMTEQKESHGLSDDDHVVFSGIEEGTIWNKILEGKTFPIKRVKKILKTQKKDPETGEIKETTTKSTDFQAFQVCVDITGLSEDENIALQNAQHYDGSSFYYNQDKAPVVLSHLPFEEAIMQPDKTSNLLYEYIDFRLPQKLHCYLLSLWEYQRHHNGELPVSGSMEGAKEIVNDAIKRMKEQHGMNDMDKEEEENTRNRLETLCLGARGRLNPMATIFGGVVGQEVMKGCSGKYTPLNQMFHFEDVNCSPPKLTEKEATPRGNRYDGMIATMGQTFVDNIRDTKVFLVGSGALGCEFMKNFAMCGVGTNVTGGQGNGVTGECS